MLGSKTELCAACKGSRRLCGRPVCPILERVKYSLEVLPLVKGRTLFGATPPSALVGESGYPIIRVGINIPPLPGGSAALYDDPQNWWGRLSLRDIIRIRARLVYSSTVTRVRSANKLIDTMREVCLSPTPTDVEALFRKPPVPELRFDGILAPRGPMGVIESLRLAENPRVPRQVQRLVDDTDASASDAVTELYRSGISVYHIMRLFTLGLLGRRRRRRLVPTRWAITAVDKILSDALLGKIRSMPEITDYEVYRTEYLGNRYTILLIPGPWTMEMIEIWLPKSVWVQGEKPAIFVTGETHQGKLRGPPDGGYYAMRLPVLEYLYSRGRQATVLVVREVTPDYYAPVGNWQIRESIRNALRGRPERPESPEDALKALVKGLSASQALLASHSSTLKSLLSQRRITEYLPG